MLVRFAKGGTVCLLGSTNWTDSSTANLECSAVLRRVGSEFEAAWLAEFAKGWQLSQSLAAALVEADRQGFGRRSASRSASMSLDRGDGGFATRPS